MKTSRTTLAKGALSLLLVGGLRPVCAQPALDELRDVAGGQASSEQTPRTVDAAEAAPAGESRSAPSAPPPESRILETRRYADAVEAAGAGTLFVTDLDNTVMEPVQDLGSDQWFYHYYNELLQKAPDARAALAQALRDYDAVQLATLMTPVEAATPAAIRRLQDRGVPVMALTIRGRPDIMRRTREELAQVGVDFRRSPPLPGGLAIPAERPALYDGGILFTDGGSKKPALAAFLEALERRGRRPSGIVYIDDNGKKLEEVRDAAQAAGLEFVGFRYGRADDKVKSLDPRLSDFELGCFHSTGVLVSNDQALRGECPGR